MTMTTSFKDQIKAMKKAPRRGNRSYLAPGLYTVEILSTIRKMAFDKSFTKRDRELFIAEFRIIKSDNEESEVGTTASWTCKDPTAENGGASDVKDFAMALLGTDPASVKDSDDKAQEQAALVAYALMGYQEAFAELEKLQPGTFKDGFQIGMRVNVETRLVKTKAGGDFTVHRWSPAEDEAEAA